MKMNAFQAKKEKRSATLPHPGTVKDYLSLVKKFLDSMRNATRTQSEPFK
jgi:hypothetical protein